MAIDQKLQVKDLLAQSQIRTMKKDLKKLREADVVKESQKIMASKPSQEVKKQQDFVLTKQAEEAKVQTQKLEQEKNRISAEQKRLEQQKQTVAAKLQPITSENKSRWEMERKLAQVDKKAEEVASRQHDIEQLQAEVKAKIAQAPKPSPTPPPQPPKPVAPVVQKPSSPPPAQKPAETPGEQIEKLKETVQASAKVENVQRKKFLEDVETWANTNK